MPAQGRYELSRICFAQLRRTCDELKGYGIEGNAVVASNDENLDIAQEYGLETVESSNESLGRRINDGYSKAGKSGADFMAPLGNDDWVDAKWIGSFALPEPGQVRCARLSAVMSEDGTRITPLRIPYMGGDGVRIYPRQMLKRTGFRPVEEHRLRAIDTSTFRRLAKVLGKNPKVVYYDLHPLQIIDFKSRRNQITSYEACCTYRHGHEIRSPFSELAKHYPSESVDAMQALYMGARV